jgi:glycosyltransferase involved in cell wall biosynthesis
MNRPTIFCSVIIPTVGRLTLARAVESALNQEFAQAPYEVVVVNDSGEPLRPERWQQSPQVRVIHTQRRRQSSARNAGASVAAGCYLLFLDDDDWLLPHALHYYWGMAQQHPEAGCLFGSFELVDDSGATLSHHSMPTTGNCSLPLVSGCWMQVAAVLVRTDVFFAVGGMCQLLNISEEIDLFARIAMCEDYAGMDTVVAHIGRGRSWQTSVDYSEVFESNRWLRDRALNTPGAFDRLRCSAGDSSYWWGRFIRLYLICMLWNWRQPRCFCRGAGRGMFAVRGLLAARTHLLASDFWRALRDNLPAV